MTEFLINGKLRKIIRIVLIAMMAWLSAAALVADRKFEIGGIETFFQALNGTNVLTIVLFSFLCYIYNKILRNLNMRAVILALIAAAAFAGCEVIGFNIYNYDNWNRDMVSTSTRAFDLIIFLGIASMMFCALTALFSYLTREKEQVKIKKEFKILGADKKTFFWLTGIFFACWLIYFLAFYPGLIHWDSYWQLEQGFGTTPYTDHHPIVHTLIMSGLIELGHKIFGTISAGIAFFVVIQMLLLAAVYAFSVFYMAKRNISFSIRLLSVLFFAVYPVFGLYSVTLWKDTWLSACILLYVIYLIEICVNRENFFKSRARLVCLVFILLGMFFFKNIGLYIFLLSLPFVFMVARKYWKKILLVSLAAISVFYVVKGPVYSAAGIAPGDEREAYSVPLQQIARIAMYHDGEITDNEKQIINEVLPYTELALRYQPWLSDRVKEAFSSAQFNTDKSKYMKTWLGLVSRFPDTAMLSFLAGSLGYWYPETTYWIKAYYPYYDFYPIVQRDTTLQQFDPLLGQYPDVNLVPLVGDNLENFLNSLVRDVPVVSMLFSIGFFYWIVFVCGLILILKKRYKMLLPVIVLFGLWLTNLASPVFSEYRYAWAVFVCAPVLIAFTVQNKVKITRNICKKDSEELSGAKEQQKF